MKTKITILFFLTFLTINQLTSQTEKQKLIRSLETNLEARVILNSNSQSVRYINFYNPSSLNLAGTTLAEKSLNFVKSYNKIYNISGVDQNLLLDKVSTDEYNKKHLKFKQYYKGIPVFSGELRFHFNENNFLTAINGSNIENIDLEVAPNISKVNSNTIAIRIIKDLKNSTESSLNVKSNELVIFEEGTLQNFTNGRKHLAYKIDVSNDITINETIFIDAHNGKLIDLYTNIKQITRELYEGSATSPSWVEGAAFPGFLNEWQQNEIVTAGHVYNFFKNAFNFISYDGADATMVTINNNPDINCPNANWNGISANFCDGTASDDVVAHEWGHAYTDFTSDLIYAYQSGALNESFSDVWGETIDLINNYNDDGENLALRNGTSCNSDRWKIGEDATAFGGAIRDMWIPTCFNDPGKVTDTAQYSCGDVDNGGVHINSGIPNHVYALLVDGGAYNGQTINSIGLTKAAHIFWRAQKEYLTSTSNFLDFAAAIETSANDLIGIDLMGLSTEASVGLSGESIISTDIQQVINAIISVELYTNPDSCGYVTILANTTPDLCEASDTNPIFYEDWENGIGSWNVTQIPVNAATWESRDWLIQSYLPSGRLGSAIQAPNPSNGDCTMDLENGIIRLESPIINIPNYSTGTFDLAFNHYVNTETDWDGGNLKYNVDGGAWTLVPDTAFTQNGYNSSVIIDDGTSTNDNPMAGELAFTGIDEGSTSGSWGQSIIDLSTLGVAANSTLQLRWEFGSDGCNGSDSGWFVDEIVIYNCAVTLSVNDFDLANISVYPNPTSSKINLQGLEKLDISSFEIYDINGRLLRKSDFKNNFIDVSGFYSGVYFLILENNNSAKKTIKFIKQ